MAMKCADLGHLASAQHVHLRWVHLLEEEMFRQGDLERERGYALSPLMDRSKTGITKSQPGVRVGGRGGESFQVQNVPRVMNGGEWTPGPSGKMNSAPS